MGVDFFGKYKNKKLKPKLKSLKKQHNSTQIKVTNFLENKKKHIKQKMFFQYYGQKSSIKTHLSMYEYFLSIILFRSNFVNTVLQAQNAIKFSHICVNYKTCTNSIYIVKFNDQITPTKSSFFLLSNNIRRLIRQNKLISSPPKNILFFIKILKIIMYKNISIKTTPYVYPFGLISAY
jgi:ribosomal protein S4